MENKLHRLGKRDFLQKVRQYYELTTPAYLRCLGTSLQCGCIRLPNSSPEYKTSNLYLANRAGIMQGELILDAGCGVCGPSTDIAEAIPNLTIFSATISTSQAKIARKSITIKNLSPHITVFVTDYHYLPFVNDFFDRVLFIESSEHSYDQFKLFCETFRVLKPGGILYIKAVFIQDRTLSEDETRLLFEGQQIYASQLTTMQQTTNQITEAGFLIIHSQALDDIIDTAPFAAAMVEHREDSNTFTELGKMHRRPTTMNVLAPVHFGEIVAQK